MKKMKKKREQSPTLKLRLLPDIIYLLASNTAVREREKGAGIIEIENERKLHKNHTMNLRCKLNY